MVYRKLSRASLDKWTSALSLCDTSDEFSGCRPFVPTFVLSVILLLVVVGPLPKVQQTIPASGGFLEITKVISREMPSKATYLQLLHWIYKFTSALFFHIYFCYYKLFYFICWNQIQSQQWLNFTFITFSV